MGSNDRRGVAGDVIFLWGRAGCFVLSCPTNQTDVTICIVQRVIEQVRTSIRGATARVVLPRYPRGGSLGQNAERGESPRFFPIRIHAITYLGRYHDELGSLASRFISSSLISFSFFFFFSSILTSSFSSCVDFSLLRAHDRSKCHNISCSGSPKST
ncbi:hypothetical protein F4809DRAFT_590749 [Biscogniauxia mediterranea]|nr:hypothetical protein F4809DRAFT_590749 [Biscogniauxia mediterranea]